jgi:Asp-tRNA(Asn)/Glu-tRNA(Gln) amidotransferase A subunit family amidase
MTAIDISGLTASEAVELIASAAISCEKLVAAYLARIAAREPEVKAWAHLDPEYAMHQARAADLLFKTGSGIGRLHGIPVGVKDIIDTADMPTENGSIIFRGRRPERDAACVAALRSAGAIILGKTITTELAGLTPNVTRNPCNLEHTPGGSSSGSAAAVADSMVPLAIGTQTGGSVIRPASFCGIYGFKPTLGLISRRGVTMQSHTLDTVGIYGRSVEDLALLADALSTYDTDDPASYPSVRPSLSAIVGAPMPFPPRFVFVKTPAWEEAVGTSTKTAFAEFVDALGPNVEEAQVPSLERAIEWHRTVMRAENVLYYGPLLDRVPEQLSRGSLERLEAGTAITARDYLTALDGRERIYRTIEGLLANYTAILTPAAAGPAPKGLDTTGNPVFNGMWTYLGVPAVTLPLLRIDSLPMGVQLIGARRNDGRLLQAARWLVERRGVGKSHG